MRKYPQLQNQYLAGNGARIGDTSIILSSFKDIDGNNITDMSVFGSKAYCTIEPGNGKQEEQISFTGITVNGDGTVSLTGVSNVEMVYGSTDKPNETPGLNKNHAGGSVLVISNTSGFYSEFLVAGDDYEIEGLYTFTEKNPKFTKDTAGDGHPDLATEEEHLITKYHLDNELNKYLEKAGDTITGNLDVNGDITTPEVNGLSTPASGDLDKAANVEYVNNIAIAGAPDAAENQKGLVEIATTAEIEAETDTGSTGAPLVVTPSKIPQPYWKATKTYEEKNMAWENGKTWRSNFDNNSNHRPSDGDKKGTPFENPERIGATSTSIGNLKFIFRDTYAFVVLSAGQLTRYTLSTPGDIDTITATDTYNVTGINNAADTPFTISYDGLSIYYVYDGGSYDYVTQYKSNIAWDFTTTTNNGSKQISNDDNCTHSIAIKTDSSVIYGFKYDGLRTKVTMSTPGNLSTGVYSTSGLNLPEFNKYIWASDYVDNGDKLFVYGDHSSHVGVNHIGVYDMTGGSPVLLLEETLKETGNYYAEAMSQDGSYIYTYDGSNNIKYKCQDLYWKDTANKYGEIKELVWANSISSYTFVDTGFINLNITDNNNVTVYLNDVKVAYFQDSSNNAASGSLAMPVYAGDVLSFSESTAVYLSIRVKE